MSLPVEVDAPAGRARRAEGCRRPKVLFPQPDSPTSPSVSPGITSRETPSTARSSACPSAEATRRARETTSAATPRERCGPWVLIRASLRMKTSDVGLGRRVCSGGSSAATCITHEGATVLETTARRQRDRRSGTIPGIVGKSLPAIALTREASQEATRVRVARIREERLGGRRALRSCPAYITAISCVNSAITPRSWLMKMILMSELVLKRTQKVENLRLDGDVERCRGLVRNQHAAARKPAPSQSSRVGACRRTRCGDTNRRAPEGAGNTDEIE